MMRLLLLACAWLALSAAAQAGEPCPAAQTGEAWSASCFAGQGSARRVKPEFLPRLDWNRHGMATIVVDEPHELLAVERSGKVVIPDIRHTGDFDYPDAEGGIGRFTVHDGKGRARCGYFAAERFTVVVAPEYDQCQAFHDGAAQACKDCVSYCTDQECHDSVLVGGHGVVLDLRGKIARRFTPPTLATACKRAGGAGKATVQRQGATAVLQCPPDADSPFKL